MTIVQEYACIANIQGILNRIYYLKNKDSYENGSNGPYKVCNLCEVFYFEDHTCTKCPLGPNKHGCGHMGTSPNQEANDSYIEYYSSSKVTIPVLERRLAYLLIQYKAAGLEIDHDYINHSQLMRNS
jgi:hypothetical protein